jgi:hypothetical protein
MVLVTDATPEQCAAAARRRKRAAKAYRPERVRFLLIAQTPPKELDRYFYFADVRSDDWLFCGVVPHFLGGPATRDKSSQLQALCELGVFLIDLKPDPCDPRPPSEFAGDLARRVKRLHPEHALLIKVDVHAAAYCLLRDRGIPVVAKRMYFPSTGRQTGFARQFKDALKTAGWKSLAPDV